MSEMTPREIVQELDKHIVGQNDAKRAVAIALRNRWRRMQVGEELRNEITPKNILMIGPTGVGKTEIARRLAHLANAPFVKVEATKFTEVGYVGREVDTIIRDLVDMSIKTTREQEMAKVRHLAEQAAEERILNALLPPARNEFGEPEEDKDSSTRQKFREKLRNGELDDKEIEMEVIGEAVKNLPASFKKKYPKIAWREIAGMRDILIHEYFGVNINVVWSTVKKDIPKFKKEIEELVEREG